MINCQSIICNDSLGNRGRCHRNLILVQGQIIVEFTGETIPGVAIVVSKAYSKNGKWSKWTWTIEIDEHDVFAVISQDWETGKYINSCTWKGAVEEFCKLFKVDVSRDVVERYLRANMSKIAFTIDETEKSRQIDPSEAIKKLIAAQNEALQLHSEAQDLLTEAKASEQEIKNEKLREKISRAKGQKMSLSDLQHFLQED